MSISARSLRARRAVRARRRLASDRRLVLWLASFRQAVRDRRDRDQFFYRCG